MRHRVSHRKLGRVTEHRIAMLRNQAQALLRHEHIETTVPKAKELRPFVERIITIAKRGIAAGRRQRQRRCTRAGWCCATSRTATSSASCSTRSRRASRRGRAATPASCALGYRRGDSAEVAQIELVGSEYNPERRDREGRSAAKPKPKGVGGRLRAAAERLRGKKAEGGEARRRTPKPSKAKQGQAALARRAAASADTRGKGAKTSTPRKAGGS